jgi:hypothetical protein
VTDRTYADTIDVLSQVDRVQDPGQPHAELQHGQSGRVCRVPVSRSAGEADGTLDSGRKRAFPYRDCEPVTKNMREALERTYNATPSPKWVVAVGDCAADGGCFAGSYAIAGGVSQVVQVDLHVAGCPPAPDALIRGLLALLERQREAARS